MPDVPPVVKKRAQVRISPAGHKNRRAWQRADFEYDGSTVKATELRTGVDLGGGPVVSVTKGGCGCGGKLGLTFILQNGDVWVVQ